MADQGVNRRRLAATLAVGLLAPRAARAFDVIVGASASRLKPEVYEPPVTIGAVYDLYKRMTAPVRVNGAGPFPFVVDTGASQTVISSELAAQLGLILGEAAEVNGVAGVKSTVTTRARLDVGKRRFAASQLLVFSAASIGGMGLLGLDDLDGQAVTLDFAGRALHVEPGKRLADDPHAVTVEAHRRSGQLTLVDADVAGMRLTAFIDSGAQNTIGNMALLDLTQARHPGLPWMRAPVVSATGQTIDAQIVSLPHLRIGGLAVPTWPVAFADLHVFRMWSLTSRPAILLGVDLLSRFEYVCLDFARNEVRFRLPANA
jgi:predicted aspartyl protease